MPRLPFLQTLGFFLIAAALPSQASEHLALPYATRPGGGKLCLDLTVPEGLEDPPLVMFIHGGGWMKGSRKGNRLAWLTKHGYAVASISYRLSPEALFPAQIHDCKGALRWLRDAANQARYGYNAAKVVAAGTSSGGHLAALMGTSGGVAALEGDIGGRTEISSRVEGVIDYYGPTDFIARSKNQPSKTDEPGGGVYQLLGGPVTQNQEAARLASPVTHVSKEDPPMLIFHGDNDQTVFLDQSQRMVEVYQAVGLDATLHVIAGGGHGFRTSDPETVAVLDFLERILR